MIEDGGGDEVDEGTDPCSLAQAAAREQPNAAVRDGHRARNSDQAGLPIAQEARQHHQPHAGFRRLNLKGVAGQVVANRQVRKGGAADPALVALAAMPADPAPARVERAGDWIERLVKA